MNNANFYSLLNEIRDLYMALSHASKFMVLPIWDQNIILSYQWTQIFFLDEWGERNQRGEKKGKCTKLKRKTIGC